MVESFRLKSLDYKYDNHYEIFPLFSFISSSLSFHSSLSFPFIYSQIFNLHFL